MADKRDVSEKTKKIYEVLPQLDDERCGYKTCGQFAKAVAEGKALCNGCVSGGPEVAAKVCEIMGTRVPGKAIASLDHNAEFFPFGLGGGIGRGVRRGIGRGQRMGPGRGMGHGSGMGRGFGRGGRGR